MGKWKNAETAQTRETERREMRSHVSSSIWSMTSSTRNLWPHTVQRKSVVRHVVQRMSFPVQIRQSIMA